MNTSNSRTRMSWSLLLTVCAVALPFTGARHLAAQDSVKSQTALELFQQYCYDCHGDGMKKGNLALDELLDQGQGVDSGREWKKAWKILRHEFMPPVDADLVPSEAERETIMEWIAGTHLGVDRENPDPGRVTVRRLNRVEYEYSVTDLFGFDMSTLRDGSGGDSMGERKGEKGLLLRDRLPPDDTAYGFDNNGDFLSLTPALLEKFFDIGEMIVRNVILMDGPEVPTQSLTRKNFEINEADEGNFAEHAAVFNVEHGGKYLLNVQYPTGGWQEFGGAFDFGIKVDGESLVQEKISVGGNHLHIYKQEITLAPGAHGLILTTDALQPDSRGDMVTLKLNPDVSITGPVDAGIYEYPESHKKIFFKGEPPADEAGRREYAHEILKRIGDKAYRRPIADDAVERLVEITMLNDNFYRGIGDSITAILASPRFLYRAEQQPQPNDPKAIHPLDEYALASRLSYMLWLSLPDDELRELASAGELRENLEAQVKRMVEDPKSKRFFEDFPGQWLRTRNVIMTPISRDGQVNPVRASMKKETEMLFEYIAREDRDLIELITANYTFLDERLANFYGVEDFEGTGFQKVDLPEESHRGGILTQGSFLVSTSNPNRTSPVKRGLYVLENLLSVEIPPPPPVVGSLEEAVGEDGEVPVTVSEQLALHRADKSCAACHAHFDPIGVALENYDVIGMWRDEENGEAISPHEETITGETLTGIADLKELFASQKMKYYRGVTEKLMTYALGRGMEPYDAVTIDKIAEELDETGGKFSTLLMAVVNSPAFQYRRGDDGTVVEPPRLNIPKEPTPEELAARRGRRGNRGNFNPANLNRGNRGNLNRGNRGNLNRGNFDPANFNRENFFQQAPENAEQAPAEAAEEGPAQTEQE